MEADSLTSVTGLSFDYVLLNVEGFLAYSVCNRTQLGNAIDNPDTDLQLIALQQRYCAQRVQASQ